jgi:hypothetical protein
MEELLDTPFVPDAIVYASDQSCVVEASQLNKRNLLGSPNQQFGQGRVLSSEPKHKVLVDRLLQVEGAFKDMRLQKEQYCATVLNDPHNMVFAFRQPTSAKRKDALDRTAYFAARIL